MRLRDLSLKTKLLMTNALMIVIPIAVLIVIGAALLGGLRHTGTLQQQVLALLWPERGAALSVQFALSSLRTESDESSGYTALRATSASSRARASVSSSSKKGRTI